MPPLNKRKDWQGFCDTTALLLWSCSIEKRAVLVGLVDHHFYPAHNFVERIMKLIGNCIHWSNPYLLSHHSQRSLGYIHHSFWYMLSSDVTVVFQCHTVLLSLWNELTCISSYDKSVCINTTDIAISLFTYFANFVAPFL